MANYSNSFIPNFKQPRQVKAQTPLYGRAKSIKVNPHIYLKKQNNYKRDRINKTVVDIDCMQVAPLKTLESLNYKVHQGPGGSEDISHVIPTSGTDEIQDFTQSFTISMGGNGYHFDRQSTNRSKSSYQMNQSSRYYGANSSLLKDRRKESPPKQYSNHLAVSRISAVANEDRCPSNNEKQRQNASVTSKGRKFSVIREAQKLNKSKLSNLDQGIVNEIAYRDLSRTMNANQSRSKMDNSIEERSSDTQQSALHFQDQYRVMMNPRGFGIFSSKLNKTLSLSKDELLREQRSKQRVQSSVNYTKKDLVVIKTQFAPSIQDNSSNIQFDNIIGIQSPTSHMDAISNQRVPAIDRIKVKSSNSNTFYRPLTTQEKRRSKIASIAHDSQKSVDHDVGNTVSSKMSNITPTPPTLLPKNMKDRLLSSQYQSSNSKRKLNCSIPQLPEKVSQKEINSNDNYSELSKSSEKVGQKSERNPFQRDNESAKDVGTSPLPPESDNDSQNNEGDSDNLYFIKSGHIQIQNMLLQNNDINLKSFDQAMYGAPIQFQAIQGQKSSVRKEIRRQKQLFDYLGKDQRVIVKDLQGKIVVSGGGTLEPRGPIALKGDSIQTLDQRMHLSQQIQNSQQISQNIQLRSQTPDQTAAKVHMCIIDKIDGATDSENNTQRTSKFEIGRPQYKDNRFLKEPTARATDDSPYFQNPRRRLTGEKISNITSSEFDGTKMVQHHFAALGNRYAAADKIVDFSPEKRLVDRLYSQQGYESARKTKMRTELRDVSQNDDEVSIAIQRTPLAHLKGKLSIPPNGLSKRGLKQIVQLNRNRETSHRHSFDFSSVSRGESISEIHHSKVARPIDRISVSKLLRNQSKTVDKRHTTLVVALKGKSKESSVEKECKKGGFFDEVSKQFQTAVKFKDPFNSSFYSQAKQAPLNATTTSFGQTKLKADVRLNDTLRDGNQIQLKSKTPIQRSLTQENHRKLREKIPDQKGIEIQQIFTLSDSFSSYPKKFKMSQKLQLGVNH